MPTLLVFGGRHLGGAVLDRFAARGFDLATLSASRSTGEQVLGRHPHALTLQADASDAESVEDAVRAVYDRFGSVDVAVNTVSPVRDGVVTAGPVDELEANAIAPYTGILLPAVFNFLRVLGRRMARSGKGTLVQVTGGSARRAMAGLGPWASAAAATRALTHSAAQELRSRGVHVALLIVDAVIESPKTAALTKGKPVESSTSHDDVVDAVEFLVDQSPRGWTHELTLTPVGDRWLP